ncbi:TIGR04283 family arsenosugar biosynthesis glycosyltransferase [Tateyamaria sp. Alg231-49]|uniref:TIGR04283 family arsenosugar biosynthesis glycosyltransferase n=1 Tax=Tateyamaria sp. Alg231-49 TaxID=1922219 RepID=UPI000D55526E|nr:TIGR04283 family arsenosugar biosynthesis glycosyltransferase [Tateyamaria sp. Alg231-49]
MPAPLSVIIPTLNASQTLPACLSSLMEGLEAGLIAELIISDGGSVDETLTQADAWGAHIITGPASRGGQLRRGCAQARANWFLILHADTVLSPGWTNAVGAHLNLRKAGYFQLKFDRGGRMVAAWANFRARLFGLPFGDQGLMIPRALYSHIDGYPDIPLMEDVAIARALKGHLIALDAQAITCSAKFRKQGWIRRGTRNLWTQARYFAGADAATLARQYRR